MEKLYNIKEILKVHSDDMDFVKYLATLFIETLPPMTKELKRATAKKDWNSIYFNAHKLKASIDLFHITSLTDVIRTIEDSGKKATSTASLKNDAEYVEKIIEACVMELQKDFELQNVH